MWPSPILDTKSFDANLGVKRVKRGKSSWILFLPRNWSTLLSLCHLSTSRRILNFWYFWPYFYLTLERFTIPSPPEIGMTPWPKNLNCKFTNLVNWWQVSKKQWCWQLLWAPFKVFKILYIGQVFSPCNRYKFQLSCKPLKLLFTPSGDKNDLKAQKESFFMRISNFKDP